VEKEKTALLRGGLLSSSAAAIEGKGESRRAGKERRNSFPDREKGENTTSPLKIGGGEMQKEADSQTVHRQGRGGPTSLSIKGGSLFYSTFDERERSQSCDQLRGSSHTTAAKKRRSDGSRPCHLGRRQGKATYYEEKEREKTIVLKWSFREREKPEPHTVEGGPPSRVRKKKAMS